jgi:hypothetical protein
MACQTARKVLSTPNQKAACCIVLIEETLSFGFHRAMKGIAECAKRFKMM